MQPTQDKLAPCSPYRAGCSHRSRHGTTSPHNLAALSSNYSNIGQELDPLRKNQIVLAIIALRILGWDTSAPPLPQWRRYAGFFLTRLWVSAPGCGPQGVLDRENGDTVEPAMKIHESIDRHPIQMRLITHSVSPFLPSARQHIAEI